MTVYVCVCDGGFVRQTVSEYAGRGHKSAEVDVEPVYYMLDAWGVFVVFLFIVVRFCVDPGIVRDGQETSFQALGGRFRARGGGFGGCPEGPRIHKQIYFYSRQDVRPEYDAHFMQRL